MKSMTQNNKIVTGNLFVEILKYLAPLILSMLIQQSYQTIDAIIIGQGVGANALGAIDATYGFIKLLINSVIILYTAASVVVAKHYGAGDIISVKNSIKVMLVLAVVTGIFITLSPLLLIKTICNVMSVPKEMLGEAMLYTEIILGGSIFMILFNCGGSILKSLGDSRLPAIALAFSCMINIVLDAFLVFCLNLGVEGVAFATVIANIVSASIVLAKLWKIYIDLEKREGTRKNDSNVLIRSIRGIMIFGVPAAGQSILFSFSNIFLQSNINKCGAKAVSAWAVCGKLDFLIWIIADGLSITGATFIAQNIGAKEGKRAKRAERYVLKIFVATIVLISTILYFTTPLLALVFIKDKAVINVAGMLMKQIAPFYVTCIGAELYSGIFRGYGKALQPVIFTLVGTIGGRTLWIFICSSIERTDIKNIILAYPFSWILTTALFIIYRLLDRKIGKMRQSYRLI